MEVILQFRVKVEIKVNTILGSNGVQSYVFLASKNDYIKSEAPTKFVPVE
ncbi:hypothetical protein [Salinibacillus kushneri]|nr:hypothetical protein [Salinibacillus kushneri]